MRKHLSSKTLSALLSLMLLLSPVMSSSADAAMAYSDKSGTAVQSSTPDTTANAHCDEMQKTSAALSEQANIKSTDCCETACQCDAMSCHAPSAILASVPQSLTLSAEFPGFDIVSRYLSLCSGPSSPPPIA